MLAFENSKIMCNTYYWFCSANVKFNDGAGFDCALFFTTSDVFPHMNTLKNSISSSASKKYPDYKVQTVLIVFLMELILLV